MDVLILLLGFTALAFAGVVWVLFWAIRSDQFEDLDGPAWRILLDDEEPTRKVVEEKSNQG